MDVITSLDQARAEIDVLEHPFYRRWRNGELRPQELSSYAQQYGHAVIALAQASGQAARHADADHADALRAHAVEEASHVELWDRFARAAALRPLRVRAGTAAETRECARSWTAGEDQLERLAVLYAIEASQPAVSRTKLEGLVQHYGYAVEGPAVEYFRVHAVRDHDHARLARELIGQLIERAGHRELATSRMVRRARRALRGNWRLLDGVEATDRRASALVGDG